LHEIHDNFGTAHLAVFLPHYDFDERHEIKISAQPPIVFDKVMKLDLRRSLLIRTLFALRSLPGVFQRGGGRQPSLGLTMDTLLKSGFVLLAKNPDKEIVLGLVGRFWSACGDLQKINAEAFQQFNQPGFAKAVWNFSLHATSSGTILRTETRVKCLDDQSRKQFARYWRIVKPFSGWVRKEALRIIKSEAEKMKETA
jgi:hypothetical protein